MSHKRAHDQVPCLFDVPEAAPPDPGSQSHRQAVSHLVSDVLKGTHKDRYTIAADMSRLSGREVSKYMLDAYCSEAREEFNLPFYLVPALEVACDSHALTAWLARVRGGRLHVGREALDAEIGRLERLRDEAAHKIKELKKKMGEPE